MVSIRTSNGGVKLSVGRKTGYKATNQIVRSAAPPTTTQYREHFNIPFDKVVGSPPYQAGPTPVPPPSSCQCEQPFTLFGQVSLVPSNAETTLVTYTVAVNQVVYLQGFNACGDADATYMLYVDSLPVAAYRTTPANLTAFLNMMQGTPNVQPGITIRLTVTCTHGGLTFNGTLLGYTQVF